MALLRKSTETINKPKRKENKALFRKPWNYVKIKLFNTPISLNVLLYVKNTQSD